ncbi:unnamed protein product [Mytilus coruscus]|uniref:Uncharacterized protein n=1 Tax=Mytilus coruscus TaxID=42192 RepID=A0A6J8CYN4_MYTCO|nr:unnamed protein product [Mytilus coruscus]
MATADDDFNMSDLDDLGLLGPLIPNFNLKVDVLEGLESSDVNVSEENNREESDADQQSTAVEFTADDFNTTALDIANLVNEPENDQDLIEMVEVVDKEKPTERFPKLTSDDKDNILDEALKWLTDREIDATFENYTVERLDYALTELYAEVRNTDGGYYAKSTLVGIRASINRHLRTQPFNKTYFILYDDSAFLKSNKMFVAMIKKVQREGMDRTKHHPSISEGDLHKLRSSDALSIHNPRTLQRKIWFDLVLSFGRRWRGNQRFFTDKTFVVRSDDCGRRFVEMAVTQSGVPKTYIIKITGNKSEASLESYYQDSSEKQKRQYSAILLGNSDNGRDKSGSTAPVPICTQPNAMPLPPHSICTQPNAMPLSPNPAPSFNAHCLNLTNTNINNQLSLPVLYKKQFEIHNSTVQVFNYNITGNAAQP